jgi:hypothetical protein
MNQSALKTFAQNARNKLRQLIGARLDYVLTADNAELRQQAVQVNELRAALKTEGRDSLIERVAYTWFNRLAALRFMDANGYHPFGARVITPATANETLPELLQQARAGALDSGLASTPVAHRSLTTGRLITELLAGRIPVDHPEAHIFKLLLIAACNFYHGLMPFMFEKIGDATELLLPEDLLTEHSIVADFRENLTDEDCRNEEVLGWFYQYYISEKKAEVDARKTAVPKEDIPAKTQLFTPHWIVRYLVENSLGRLWLLNRPNSRLREKMPYYVEGEPETEFLKISKPEEIRLLDDACGSGHMLTYAFDLLYAIYEEEGYDAPEIPGLILKHNLYGVDICDRAVALAAFALCMKARAKDSRFFRRVVQPHLISLQEIRFAEGELQAYFKALGHQPSTISPQLLQLLHQFEEAKNFGALIQPCLSESAIAAAREKVSTLNSQLASRDLTVAQTHASVLRVLEQAECLCQRYHFVVANPPYLGSRVMNRKLTEFAKVCFPHTKADLFAMFIERNLRLTTPRGIVAMVTMQSWMFLSSFEDFRSELLRKHHLSSLLHLGAHGFDSITGEVVQTAAFSITAQRTAGPPGTFFDLTVGASEQEKANATIDIIRGLRPHARFTVTEQQFQKIPGAPIAYAVSDNVRAIFATSPSLSDIAEPRAGLATGDNPQFQRHWFEVSLHNIAFDCRSDTESATRVERWYPCSSGDEFRKWYRKSTEVVNWQHDGRELRNFTDPDGRQRSRPQNTAFYFRPGITWNKLSSSIFAVRLQDAGWIFDDTSRAAFVKEDNRLVPLLSLLVSKLATQFLNLLNPTMSYTSGDLARIPVLGLNQVDTTSSENAIALARADWDNFETSWHFRDPPFLRPGLQAAALEESWQNWKAQCDTAVRRMQELETENNRLFIAAYGLQDELKPEVPESQITLARADARKDMAAFLSYAVGCMFGRYSLDQPGLILADAGVTAQDYLARIPQPTFAPDADGILPVLDGEWFQDDIVGRSREFLRVTCGEDNLAQNIAFIEASLGKSDAKTGKMKSTDLRTYFVRDFYKNHISQERPYGYKKRPIYWMFSSPEGSFQALIYLHRYTRDTVNLLLNDYVREFIHKLEEKQRQLTAVTLNEAARPGDRTKAVKELGKIDKMLKEIRAWERDVLLPLAHQRIELDLDDGVKVNYLKFKGAVVNIPGLDKGEED